MFNDYIQIPWKKKYILDPSSRPQVDCILCAIVNNNPAVANYEIWRNELFIVTLNLYPYMVAHAMVFPTRHITDFEQLSDGELLLLSKITKAYIRMCRDVYNVQDFNVGFNQGKNAGGSIDHFHQHIVPRFPRELNFIDIIGKTRVLIESLEETQSRLKEKSHYIDEELKNPESGRKHDK